ncbi:MAG: hypothetical protein AABZ06_13525 [Bdellovibrionota bacterium]
MRQLFIIFFLLAVVATIVAIPKQGHTEDFVVYSVYRGLDLGIAGESPQKDFYVNIGLANGAKPGTILFVSRRTASYDLLGEKIHKEVTFPIAKLKVIHVEKGISIARLEKMLPLEKTPSVTPFTVMVGDLVKIAASSE